jgi:hypothetical protein
MAYSRPRSHKVTQPKNQGVSVQSNFFVYFNVQL